MFNETKGGMLEVNQYGAAVITGQAPSIYGEWIETEISTEFTASMLNGISVTASPGASTLLREPEYIMLDDEGGLDEPNTHGQSVIVIYRP